MGNELWIKKINQPELKPLNQWRDELYGYWMVFSDTKQKNGEKMVIARYYGTDKDKLYTLYDELHSASKEPTVGIVLNKRSSWMGGVFLDKPES